MTGQKFVPDQILVKFKPEINDEMQNEIVQTHDATIELVIPHIKVKVVKVNAEDRDHILDAMSHDPSVEFAEPNLIVSTAYTPSDSNFTQAQWDMKTVSAPQAWDITKGDPSVIIAILDTGVSQTHLDLAGKIAMNINFTDSPTFDDIYGHGTHVAGIAAAATDNGIGIAGLGFNSRIANVKVMSDIGSGSISGVANGIIWATDNGAKVISMSLGAPGANSSTWRDAVNYAWGKGAVIVAAAGNDATDEQFYPAVYPNVIAVASTDITEQLSPYSNYGDWVDIAAPGGPIWSTVPNNGYNYKSGTSMATPHVAGLAGLLFAVAKDTNGNGFVNDEVRKCIETTADLIGQITNISAGRINAYKAVQCAGGVAGDTTPPTASITSPASGSTVSGTTTIQASATDNVGVAKVELYNNGALFGTDTASPYNFAWDTTQSPSGQYSLQSKAYDAANNIGSSAPITVTVDNTPPTVSLTGPSVTTAARRSTITIAATASDNIAVAKVEFYVNGALQCLDTSSPYSCAWKVPAAPKKTYTVVANAYDTAGNVATSPLITITSQ